MKIKHFAGYGSVTAKKLSLTDDTLVVEVRGEHEYGLDREDPMTIFEWLVKRFDKRRTDWLEIAKVSCDNKLFEKPENYSGYEQVCTYTIKFKMKK